MVGIRDMECGIEFEASGQIVSRYCFMLTKQGHSIELLLVLNVFCYCSCIYLNYLNLQTSRINSVETTKIDRTVLYAIVQFI